MITIRKPRIYLAGTQSKYKYRNWVTKTYSHIFDIIDPFVEVDHNMLPSEIVKRDLELIDKCDILIAYIYEKTFGTTMELFYAYNKGKQVYVVTNPEFALDPWLKSHSTRRFYFIDSCMNSALNYFGLLFEPKEQNINEYEGNKTMESTVFKGEKRMKHKDGNMNMGEVANAGMCMDDSKNATRLLQKNFSPLVVRKFQILSWPMFIGVICDANLDDLDDVVLNSVDKCKDLGFLNGTIQGSRNTCGFISEEISNHYNAIKRNCMEGSLVFWYVDKCAIASATGDLMSHEKCCMEFYQIVNILTKI